MTLTFDIDDQLLSSIEEHLATQLIQVADKDTGAQRVARKFASAEEFLGDVLHQTIYQLVRMYPPDSLRSHFAASKQAEDLLKSACKPIAVDAATLQARLNKK